MSEPELKDCPFCGTNEGVSPHHNGLDLWSVGCCGCGIKIEEWGGGYHEKHQAVKAWNTRKTKIEMKQT